MARTFTEAFEQIKGPDLDMAIGLVKARPIHPPTDADIEIAFSKFDLGTTGRMAGKLAKVCRRPYQDAEDAVQDGFKHLLEQRPELFRQDPEYWMGLLYVTSRLQLLKIKASSWRVCLMEDLVGAVDESDQDAEINVAWRQCFAETHTEDKQAGLLSRPEFGHIWTREEIIGAIVRFRDYFGQPPKWSDFKAINGLPSPTTVSRHFESLAEAVLAAGMTPATSGVRRKPYTEEETVKKCLKFREREGRWPDWADIKSEPGRVPPGSALKRFFGGTRPCDIQRGVEGFLAGSQRRSAVAA